MISLDLSAHELALVVAALNCATEFIEDPELATVVGCDKDTMYDIVDRLHEVRKTL